MQTDEVQAVLEGFLPNDLDAIEKECAPGRDANVDESINFWKAPLTGEQAEVVKALQFVSFSSRPFHGSNVMRGADFEAVDDC